MAYTKSILFDFVSTSPNNGKIVASITDTAPSGTKNVYYEILGPLGVVRSPDFNTPDGTLTIGTPTANMPLVTVPMDSYGDWLEGTYTIKFHISDALLPPPPIYDAQASTFLLDVKKQGTTNCVIKPSIEVNIDCHCLKMLVSDVTAYTGVTLISREITIVPPTIPNTPAPVNITTVQPNIEIDFSYTNVSYGITLYSVYEHTYNNGEITVQEDIAGTDTYKIVCQRNLCKLIKCLEEKVNALIKKAAKVGGFESLPLELRDEYYLLQQYLFLYNVFANCGDWVKADKYFDLLSAALDCDCGCSNSEMDTPIAVTPACGVSGAVTSIIPSSPQIVIGTAGTAVTIGLDPNFVAAALAQPVVVGTTGQITVTYNALTKTYTVALDAALSLAITTLLANALTDVTTTTPGYINITTPSAGIRQVDFDPTPLLDSGVVTFTNANANNSFGTVDFDNTPTPLQYEDNVAYKHRNVNGTFKYNGYNPGIALCILQAATITVPTGTRTGQKVPCFDDSGNHVGCLMLIVIGTAANLAFLHTPAYIQNSNVTANGTYHLA